jgi:hypothetical protein
MFTSGSKHGIFYIGVLEYSNRIHAGKPWGTKSKMAAMRFADWDISSELWFYLT